MPGDSVVWALRSSNTMAVKRYWLTPVIFPPQVPAVLGDPAQWQRFAQLRERVETDPDGLDEVRAVWAPVERDLWDAADDAWEDDE